jgi:pyruvate,water dikinase
MKLVLSLKEIGKEDRRLVGGKAYSLAVMKQQGLAVPDALCVTVEAYDEYVTSTGLRERIMMELSRKSFGEMRWEEMWDASLRIRNMFLKTPIANELVNAIKSHVEPVFNEKAVVVRSSALGEDSSRTSFAGLHESYVNVRGIASILDHVRLVWASLWSDRALLYRQELGLDVEKSKIGVVIQKIVVGEKSGIVFGKSPDNRPLMIVEAVYGMNQGLVDGTLTPDRWLLERNSGRVVSYTPAEKDKIVVPSNKGIQLVYLQNQKGAPPVSEEELSQLFDVALKSEEVFGAPQDIEWTFAGKQMYVLQSRPITTIKSGEPEDNRIFYLGLRKSFENLRSLRKRIEEELIPAMIEEGKSLSTVDPSRLSDSELAKEIERRSKINKKWVDIYWKDFIPFAHGVRLFGQVYNDAVRPTDPYEFTNLLTGTKMLSLQRNKLLEEMSRMIREDRTLSKNLTKQHYKHIDERFEKKLKSFTEKFGSYLCSAGGCRAERETIIKLLLELASKAPTRKKVKETSAQKKEQLFLSRFEGEQKQYTIELLDLARASYRLRDDDNIHLGNIQTQLVAAVNEARRRTKIELEVEEIDTEEIARVLRDKTYVPKISKKPSESSQDLELSARQLTGQPASPGIANGKARVISKSSDLFEMRKGEVLVCDAIDPNMTFVVPLSSGIVERRGGMLIHGAIIAREYGIPCVTGVSDATRLIHRGDQVVVDGYLGIVTITSKAS